MGGLRWRALYWRLVTADREQAPSLCLRCLHHLPRSLSAERPAGVPVRRRCSDVGGGDEPGPPRNARDRAALAAQRAAREGRPLLSRRGAARLSGPRPGRAPAKGARGARAGPERGGHHVAHRTAPRRSAGPRPVLQAARAARLRAPRGGNHDPAARRRDVALGLRPSALFRDPPGGLLRRLPPGTAQGRRGGEPAILRSARVVARATRQRQERLLRSSARRGGLPLLPPQRRAGSRDRLRMGGGRPRPGRDRVRGLQLCALGLGHQQRL